VKKNRCVSTAVGAIRHSQQADSAFTTLSTLDSLPKKFNRAADCPMTASNLPESRFETPTASRWFIELNSEARATACAVPLVPFATSTPRPLSLT